MYIDIVDSNNDKKNKSSANVIFIKLFERFYKKGNIELISNQICKVIILLFKYFI